MRDGRSRAIDRRRLCAHADLAEGETRLVATADARTPDFFLVRRGGRVRAYLNDCPHRNLPLDLVPGRFLDREGVHILCTGHGARVDVDTGACVSGPCRGQSLTPVPLDLSGGAVRLAAETVGRWNVTPAARPRDDGRAGGLPE